MNVSVVVPTRNRSESLAMTMRSVLRQRDVDVEVIVVNEASTDDTAAMLAAIGDPRVRVLFHDTAQGLAAARNHGAAEARGDWLAFLDDDDLWAPDKLVSQLNAGEQTGRDWVYTGAVNICDGRICHCRPPLPPEETLTLLPRYNAIPGGASNAIWRRTAWSKVGQFDTRFEGGEDWDMWIRLAQHGPPAWVCRPLIAKRLHSTNMFSDVAAIVRAIKLIESLHQTQVDWGRHHHWFAYVYLRTGRPWAAIGQFATAAIRGQLGPVVADLTALIQDRFSHRFSAVGPSGVSSDTWKAMAVAWLRELDNRIE